MYHKGFNIFIQSYFSKFFFINEFYFLNNEQSLGGSIGLSNKFWLVKLNVSIIEGKERHF